MEKTKTKEFLTMRDKFYKEPKIEALLEKKRRYISNYDYVNAIKTNDMIEMLFDKYSAESEKKSNNILDAMLGLEDERDSKRVVTEFFSSIMMINAVDFMIADIKETLKKHGDRRVYSAMDSLVKLGRECESQVKMSLRGWDESLVERFSEETDALQELSMKQVESIYDGLVKIRKHDTNA